MEVAENNESSMTFYLRANLFCPLLYSVGYTLPPLGCSFPVVVICESLKHFIATPLAWLNELDNTVEGLTWISMLLAKLPNKLLRPGVPCVVPYGGGWYRARIRSVQKSADVCTLRVRLVDLGVVLHVDSHQALLLPHQLLPVNKPPLCFAVKKTPELLRGVSVGDLCLISLDHKAKDNSWVVLEHQPLFVSNSDMCDPPFSST